MTEVGWLGSNVGEFSGAHMRMWSANENRRPNTSVGRGGYAGAALDPDRDEVRIERLVAGVA
jgi:hypothetical protein